jgi:AcrR family transcriptional regulator
VGQNDPVASDRTNAGDPARTIALLWGQPQATSAPRRRGPERGLRVETEVDAATRLADRDGLDAVTMRRLAQELGVSTMSLYTYVPGKAELVDLMLDAAYLRLPKPGLADMPWRDRVTRSPTETVSSTWRTPGPAASPRCARRWAPA